MKLSLSAPRQQTVARRAPLRPQAIFGNSFKLPSFAPSTANKRSTNKKVELLDSLLRLTEDCDAGFKTRPAEREAIAEIVDELQAYCPKNPLSRPELLGRWEVRYASKPTTAGGPFKSAPGRVVFPGQVAIQEIQEPDVIINEISFKTLGFVPGSVTQVGSITPISGAAFEIEFPNSTKKVGGPQKRTIELLYLDEDVRIARAVPREEGQESSFYVFQREGVEFEFDDEDEVESRPARGARPAAAVAPAGQSNARQSAEEARAERAAAAEQAKMERARAAEERAAAAAQAKLEREAAAEEARAEREALAARKAAAKESYAELSADARESALAAQATAKELSVLEREAAKTVRDAANARRSIEKAESVVGSLVEKLEASMAEEVTLEKELLAAQRELNLVRAELNKTKKALSP